MKWQGVMALAESVAAATDLAKEGSCEICEELESLCICEEEA